MHSPSVCPRLDAWWRRPARTSVRLTSLTITTPQSEFLAQGSPERAVRRARYVPFSLASDRLNRKDRWVHVSESSAAQATVILSRTEASAIFRILQASEHLPFEAVGPRDFVRGVRDDFEALLLQMGYDTGR